MLRKLDKRDWLPRRKPGNKQSSWQKLRESMTCRSSYSHRLLRGKEKFKKNKIEKKEFKEKLEKLKKGKRLPRLKRRGSQRREGSKLRKQKPPPKLRENLRRGSLLRKLPQRRPESLLN